MTAQIKELMDRFDIGHEAWHRRKDSKGNFIRDTSGQIADMVLGVEDPSDGVQLLLDDGSIVFAEVGVRNRLDIDKPYGEYFRITPEGHIIVRPDLTMQRYDLNREIQDIITRQGCYNSVWMFYSYRKPHLRLSVHQKGCYNGMDKYQRPIFYVYEEGKDEEYIMSNEIEFGADGRLIKGAKVWMPKSRKEREKREIEQRRQTEIRAKELAEVKALADAQLTTPTQTTTLTNNEPRTELYALIDKIVDEVTANGNKL